MILPGKRRRAGSGSPINKIRPKITFSLLPWKLPEYCLPTLCLLLKSISCMLFIYNFKDNLTCKISSAEMWVLISKHHLLHLWLMDCYESELINL